MNGCCVDREWYERTGRGDKGCTPETCMALPEGERCGECRHFRHCAAIYGVEAKMTTCDFFPRRFVRRPTTDGGSHGE